MLHIIFEYKDKYNKNNWCRQECYMNSVEDCIEWYGLGSDCEYRIVDVKEIGVK